VSDSSARSAYLAAAVLSASAASACAGERLAPSALGTACTSVDGAGLPPGAVCADERCLAGVSCDEVLEAEDRDTLAAAIARATARSCVVPRPGSYGDVTLPAGVSLLGRGASEVHLGRVTLTGGGSMLRGVQALSVRALGGTSRLESACVRGADFGIDVHGGAALSVRAAHVRDVAGAAVTSSGASLTLSDVLLTDATGPGIWAACDGGCQCAAVPNVMLANVVIERAALVGAALHGVKGSIEGLAIRDTSVADFAGGAGLSLAHCSTIEATGVEVRIRADLSGYGAFGVLVWSAGGSLGAPGEDKGIIIVGGRPGVWIMDPLGVGAATALRNFEIRDSRGVGLGTSAAAKGIIIVGGKIGATAATPIPLAEGGSGSVGDGVSWSEGAELQIDGLEVSASGRQSMLIHGPVGPASRIANLSLRDGDEISGVLHQGVRDGDASPALGAGAPGVTKSPAVKHKVAAAPAVP
jgi:hypothetical protein